MERMTDVDKKVSRLNPELDDIPQIKYDGESTYPVKRIWNAYRYFRSTKSGAGLVELAFLLEDRDIGWLCNFLKTERPEVDQGDLPGKKTWGRLRRLIECLRNTKANDFADGLVEFNLTRNDSVHGPHPSPEQIEVAVSHFLSFMEWYFRDYLMTNCVVILTEEEYFKKLNKGHEFACRYKVISDIKSADPLNKTQTYEVIDKQGNPNIRYVAKRISVHSERYRKILESEKRFHSQFNGSPYISKFLASVPELPVGEVIILEHHDGINLKEWLETNDLSTKESFNNYLYIIDRILDGLTLLHDKGFIYGGVRPENIIVDDKYHVRISNFDYCTKSTDFEPAEYFYRQNDRYSPRLARRASRTPALDTFAVGMLLFDYMDNAQNIPNELRDFCQDATHVNPAVRFRDARAMRAKFWPIYESVRFIRPGIGLSNHKVALISCTRRKLNSECPARELYSESDRFTRVRDFVETKVNGYDDYFILSGRYGLVEKDQILRPYDCDLVEFTEKEKMSWAIDVVRILKWKHADTTTKFVVYADPLYQSLLEKALTENSLSFEVGDFS